MGFGRALNVARIFCGTSGEKSSGGTFAPRIVGARMARIASAWVIDRGIVDLGLVERGGKARGPKP